MKKFEPSVGVKEKRHKINHFRSVIAQNIAHRLLHPAIGKENPYGAQVCGKRNNPDCCRMRCFRKFFPAECPDADENRFEKEGYRGFNGQRRAEDIADVLCVLGPIHTELKFHGNAGDDPEGEVDKKEFSPELRHAKPCLIPGADITALHPSGQDRKPQGKRYENKMKGACDGKLPSAQEQNIHRYLPEKIIVYCSRRSARADRQG
jgi:hypothetical protein